MRRSLIRKVTENEFEAWDEGNPHYFDERGGQTLRLSPGPSLSHFLPCASGNSRITTAQNTQLICIWKPASQAAAIKEVSTDRGVFVGARSSGRNGVALSRI